MIMDSSSEQTLIVTLPEDLIIDNILPRLPGKSLIRFKIVSKSWRSIISSRKFAISHLKFSRLCPKFVVLLEEDGRYKLQLLDNDENNNSILDLDDNLAFTERRLVGCWNGLICFYHRVANDDDYFCVWNPLTRECRKIIGPSDDKRVAREYGFYCESSTNDYKIVALFSGDGSEDCVYYFSFKLGKWKRVPGIKFTGSIYFGGRQLIFHSANNLLYGQEDSCIFGFDPGEEVWRIIPFMNWLSRYNSVAMFSMKECLAMFCSGEDIWVSKPDGGFDSWEKKYIQGMDFRVITSTGKCLFQGLDRVKIVDLHQGTPDESGVVFNFSGNFRGCGSYLENLVSPMLPSTEANPA